MPAWEDLSAWMKVQMLAAALNQWEFWTFNINVHPELEAEWLQKGLDPRVMLRDRLRRELDRLVRPRLEHFFVIEGWSNRTGAETHLHMHGGAAIYEPGEEDLIEQAAARAGGHHMGRPSVGRAIHKKEFTRERAGYATYLFKNAKRADDRLPSRRLTMSRSAVGAARELWDTITGKIDW